VYGQNDIWHDELNQVAFSNEKMNAIQEPTSEQIYEEIMLIRDNYGNDIVEGYLKSFKNSENRPLRSLAQQENVI
jgi:hypothetical protein